MLPPSMDLPPSFQKPSIFDDADALVALTGKVPGSEMAASYVDPGILNLLAADPDAASTKPIAMNSSLGPAAGATGGIPGGVQNPPKRVVARSLTNNTPSFIAAASCPNDDFLSKMNAETVRKAQNMSMGRSPTILSTINGLSSQMGDLSLNSNAAGASKEGSAPQQFSSRARASILIPPQPRVADVAEEEDEDEDEDEDEGDDVDGDVGDDDELTFGM